MLSEDRQEYIDHLSAVTSDLAWYVFVCSTTQVTRFEAEVGITVETLIQDALSMVDLAKGIQGCEQVSSEQLQNKCDEVSSTYRSLLQECMEHVTDTVSERAVWTYIVSA